MTEEQIQELIRHRLRANSLDWGAAIVQILTALNRRSAYVERLLSAMAEEIAQLQQHCPKTTLAVTQIAIDHMEDMEK